MVLESWVDPFTAEKKPEELILYGFFYSVIAIALSLLVFPSLSTIVSVFLVVLSFIPLVHTTFKIEENRDLILQDEKNMLKGHSHAIRFFLYLFVGITLAYLVYYLFLPSQIIENLFSSQIETLTQINGGSKLIYIGNSIFSGKESFIRIFLNNFKVLIFCLIFSLFYGAGAIFILTWNASVIATAIGSLIKNSLATFTTLTPLIYIHIFSKSFMRYFFHGIIEMLAYFVGALAGGILSIAIIRKEYYNKNFEKILVDVSDMVLLAILLLLIGAFLEVYITPILF